MSWTTPRTWNPGELVTANMMNVHVRDNLNALKGESFGVQTFRNLYMRRYPHAHSSIEVSADEVTMDDGTRTSSWSGNLVSALLSGAGGLDTGVIVNNAWYEIHAIAKDDGTKSLIFHKAPLYIAAIGGASTTTTCTLRDATARSRLAQGFTLGSAFYLAHIDVALAKVGSPDGVIWLEVYADAAGVPTGSPLATSDAVLGTHLSTATQLIRFIFRVPLVIAASTTYHLVWNSSSTVSGANYMLVGGNTSNTYAGGVAQAYNGSTWSTGGVSGSVVDLSFGIYSVEATAITMPSGYTKKALLGYAKHQTGNVFMEMYQHDRRVFTEHAAVVSGGASTGGATPVDISAAVPAVPCTIVACGQASLADTAIFLGGAPGGFSDSGLQRAYTHVAMANGIIPFPLIFTEHQQAYYYRTSGSGTITIYIQGFQW